MSELPSVVRVKRKRGAEPTPDLFLEGPSQKRHHIWQFRLQQAHPARADALSKLPEDASPRKPGLATASASVGQRQILEANGANSTGARRREFRLLVDHNKSAQERAPGLEGKKRKAQTEHDIPTFVEATAKKRRFEDGFHTPHTPTQSGDSKPATPLKRPGANARVKQHPSSSVSPQVPAPTSAQPSDRLADALHRFALQEAANEAAHKEPREKPKVAHVPRKSVPRYKDRHSEHFAAGHPPTEVPDVDMDVSDEEDYVYDTYVRTREPVVPAAIEGSDPASLRVGYIVITESDQPYWETYFEDDDTDKEWDTDEEDENAENFYGADYPEDEVASDDEHDRGAYGYRNAASDDEQWDSDTGAWSEDGDVMQNPWRKYPWLKDQHGPARSDTDANDADE
ncbi:hypothetical protein MBLNU459_g0489t1 [Dothideomycetes sp. NU459]